MTAVSVTGFPFFPGEMEPALPLGEAGTSESPDALPTSLQIMESHFRWEEVVRGLV